MEPCLWQPVDNFLQVLVVDVVLGFEVDEATLQVAVEVAADRFGVVGAKDPFEARVKVERGHI